MKHILYALLITAVFGCTVTKTHQDQTETVQVTFIQINDVYEIDALEAGKSGGMARVASLKDQLKAKNPNTLLIMAGDFISPSIYNSLKVDGSLVRGKQMIDAMNVAGMDLVGFGNHEFDIKEHELQERINESAFDWISGNAYHSSNSVATPFIKEQNGMKDTFPETRILTFVAPSGKTIRLGVINTCLPFNKANYVVYTDPLSTLEKHYNEIAGSCDAVIAITHQAIDDDIELAKRLPKLSLIMGGHEHDMRIHQIGKVWITKAHANSKSAYVNTITFQITGKTVSHHTEKPELVYLNESIPQQAATQAVVKKWSAKANANFASMGFQSERVILQQGDSLEGRESYVRSTSTNLTRLVVKAMEFAAPDADFAIVNSGSIRVDDVLKMPLTEYDIIRTMPYGGSIPVAEIKGSLVKKILLIGLSNRGTGGFLQYSESLQIKDGMVYYKNAPLELDKYYRVALSDFLLTGGEANLGFLKPSNPEIREVFTIAETPDNPQKDIRIAVIQYITR